jgi:hypothetical protein
VTIRVACLGDSITRAQVSVDYLDLLAQRHAASELALFRSASMATSPTTSCSASTR